MPTSGLLASAAGGTRSTACQVPPTRWSCQRLPAGAAVSASTATRSSRCGNTSSRPAGSTSALPAFRSSGSGAPANALVTVSTDAGAVTTADADPNYAGVQVQADGAGHFSFTVQAPANGTAMHLSAAEVTGAAAGTATVPLTAAASAQHFKFGTGSSAPAGYTVVTPATAYGAAQVKISSQEGCTLRLEPSGSVTCISSHADQGQGVETALAQLVAERVRGALGPFGRGHRIRGGGQDQHRGQDARTGSGRWLRGHRPRAAQQQPLREQRTEQRGPAAPLLDELPGALRGHPGRGVIAVGGQGGIEAGG